MRWIKCWEKSNLIVVLKISREDGEQDVNEINIIFYTNYWWMKINLERWWKFIQSLSKLTKRLKRISSNSQINTIKHIKPIFLPSFFKKLINYEVKLRQKNIIFLKNHLHFEVLVVLQSIHSFFTNVLVLIKNNLKIRIKKLDLYIRSLNAKIYMLYTMRRLVN